MELLLIRELVVIAATAIAAYTDYKTGFINDWLTYPLIAIGILLQGIEFGLTREFDIMGFVVPLIVFGTGLALYYAGKTGGGDVKLLAGISAVLPFYNGSVFVLSVLLFATLLAIVVLGAHFIARYAASKPDWKENRQQLPLAALLAVGFGAYLWFGWKYGLFSATGIAILGIPMAVAVAFLALEYGIRKTFFLEEVALDDLEEDEIVAREFTDEATRTVLAKSPLGVLTKNTINELRKAGIARVNVYRRLPPFGPFLLAGVLASIAFSGWLSIALPVYAIP